MTRINTIAPALLTNEHLIAELRELPRIPNTIASGKAKIDLSKIPASYRLGSGHVLFFYNKLAFLQSRHNALREEYLNRTGKHFAIDIDWRWLDSSPLKGALYNDWQATAEDHKLNLSRIAERLHLRKKAYTYPAAKIASDQDVINYLSHCHSKIEE